MKKPLTYWIGYGYTLLTIIATAVIVYLKLNENITFSWWWVFAPLWASLLSGFGLLGICYLIVIIWGAEIDVDR